MKFNIDEFDNKYYLGDSNISKIEIEYEEYTEKFEKPNSVSIEISAIKIRGKKKLPVKISLRFIHPMEIYFFEDFSSASTLTHYRFIHQSDGTYYFSADPYADNKSERHKDDNQYIICEDVKVLELTKN